MKNARITVKNYRGFTDRQPATIEIGDGFTALIGKNNAGKSTVKLLIYELRNLFPTLLQMDPQSTPGFFSMVQGAEVDIHYLGVSDPEELFNNQNSRALSIEIEVIGAEPPTSGDTALCKVLLTADRTTYRRWTLKTFAINDPDQPLVFPQGVEIVEIGRVRSVQNPNVIYDVRDLAAVLQGLLSSRYYGPFRNAINVGAADHFDLKTGTSFINLWDGWKTSGVKAQTRAIGQVTEDIRRLFDFRQLEINASPSLNTLMVTIDGHTYRLAELGSGIAQFIMVLGNAATTRPSLLLIDEPETNLHPSLQIDFLLALAQYASVGCVFSSHSVGLARSVATRLYSFQKSEQGPLVRPFEVTPNYVEFLGELSFSAFKEMGHDRLLLVEGVNDVKAVQQLLRLVHKEHTTVILPLGGNQLVSGERDAELNELKRLSNNIFAIIDSERVAAGAHLAAGRTAFVDTCKKLDIKVCVTERRAIENYFSDRAVKAAFGDSFTMLEPYQALRELSNGWKKSDNWKIARQMGIEELVETDLGKFINAM